MFIVVYITAVALPLASSLRPVGMAVDQQPKVITETNITYEYLLHTAMQLCICVCVELWCQSLKGQFVCSDSAVSSLKILQLCASA